MVEDRLESRDLLRRDEIGLRDNEGVGELDLFDQQLDDRAIVVLSEANPALSELVRRCVLVEEACRVDDGHHRIDAGDVREAETFLVAERERRRHRHRLRDPGRLDQERFERM